MSQRAIFNLCLKVMGVYFALSALNMFPSSLSQTVLFWNAWQDMSRNDVFGIAINYRIVTLVGCLIPILLFFFALVIISKSELMARYLLKNEGTSSNIPTGDLSITMLDIAIKIFGFFAIMSSVPAISAIMSRYWVMGENMKFFNDTGKIELVSSAITAIIYIGAGLLLISYSQVVVNKLYKTRSDKVEDVSTDAD